MATKKAKTKKSKWKFGMPVMLKRGTTSTTKKSKQTKKGKKADEKRFAMLPGKRLSKNGNIYYENRPNRSDT